jgi:hypothetical protein
MDKVTTSMLKPVIRHNEQLFCLRVRSLCGLSFMGHQKSVSYEIQPTSVTRRNVHKRIKEVQKCYKAAGSMMM